MFTDLFQALLEWIQQNPHWAYAGVFLTAALESLAIVGLFLPGVAIMFGIGALVAAGALELGPTLLWAALGAVVGDGVSFWLGRHFHQRLRVIWPFKRYPALMNRGVDFFHRHGGKSVILARFIGPVRPILPAVAGMLDMPPRRFFLVNAFSALLWAPAYTLPGVVFGASMGLAAEVAGRLAVLLLMLVVVTWFGVWLVRRTLRFLQPRAGFLLTRMQDWGERRKWTEPLVDAVLDPNHPEARGLLLLVVLLAGASLLTAWLFSGWLAGLNLFLFETLRELRTPVADGVLVIVTGLGDALVLYAILGVGCMWLALRGRYKAAAHWLASAVATTALTQLLKHVIAAPRPRQFDDGLSAYAFPSHHASLSVAVYGFLAVLIARELAPTRRWLPYTGAALLIIPIAFSRLYLAAHWLSDVLAGLALGLAVVALFGIAYRRHPAEALGWRSLALASLTGLIVVNGGYAGSQLSERIALYTEPHEIHTTTAEHWWQDSWRTLPARRHDFRANDRQPLNVQYAGDLNALSAKLQTRGWEIPTAFSSTSALQWISPEPVPAALPVLPQVHDGQHEELRLVRQMADGTLLIVRFWRTQWQLSAPATPLWMGSVAELRLDRRLHLFNYLVTTGESSAPLQVFGNDIADICNAERRTRIHPAETVLLVRERGSDTATLSAPDALPGS